MSGTFAKPERGSEEPGDRSRTRVLAASLAVILVAAIRLPASAQEPEILVELTATQVYEGQSVIYRVTLNHVENPSPPELKGFDDFEVTSLGQRSLDSTSITIINGRMTQVVRRGRQYTYRLTPRKTGLLTIPAPVAQVDGRVLTGPERTLQVRPADQQDVVFLAITSDRPSVYPMQPFTVTLTVLVKQLPDPLGDENPVAGRRTAPPALTIPWAVDEELPDGLEPEVDWQRWLAPMQTHSGEGFSINNVGRSSVFSLFDGRPMTFQPQMRRVTRRDSGQKETGYWQYAFPRTFVAKRIGAYTFGPARLEGTFFTRISAGRRLVGESIYAMAKPLEVAVKDVPTEGRPDTFTGAIGRFTLRGDLEPKQAKVGDPMTLSLTLTGEGTLGTTFAPALDQIPGIAGRFKVYEATEETSDQSSRFTYALRPLEAGIREFPPVPLSYFDVQTERYVTLRTDPVPITVTAADQLSEDQIVAAPRASASGSRELEARREGIFANVTDAGAVRDESVRPGRWLAALGGLVGLYLAVAVVTVRVQRLTGDRALVRRRGAAAGARARLRTARCALEAGNLREGTELLEAALVHLVADVADVPTAGLTPKDVCGHLRSLGVDEGLIERVGCFLDACDAGRYGASQQSAGDMIRQAEDLLAGTIRSLDAKKRFR